MKNVHLYDKETGDYIEDQIVFPYQEEIIEDGEMIGYKEIYDIPENSTELPLPQPNWKPVFKDGSWIETITQEELDKMNESQLQQPSEIERLNNVTTEMKAKQETLEQENAGLVLSSIKKEMALEVVQEEQSTLVLNLIKGGVL
ncbi:hypothetical protein [Bacillus sp. BP-3]|uniref:hypothetical protein n=1 Tax=Bacillus sp. BP-3 TaxID=3022773 RepID=UPI00232D354B|nr:hypothetical protein [Bacillus sp. BP-3]MDC2863794.1 hypothetical protein [Bacillus sp. BP-3]